MMSLTLCVIGILSYLFFTFYAGRWHLTPDIVISPNRPFYRDDPHLGYSINPGKYEISLIDRQKHPHSFKVRILSDGYRDTGTPAGPLETKEIWIFGCSYSWGWLMDDESTFPWLVQKDFPHNRVRNLSVNGYGSIQALLQLQQELTAGHKPYIAVFPYNSFYLPRNVGAPSRLKEFQNIDNVRTFHHPRAVLPGDGKLKISMVPLVASDDPDPDREEMVRVTEAILKRIKDLCDENGIKALLALQTGSLEEPEMVYASRLGFKIVDISVDLNDRRFNFMPLDPHPNRSAHKMYAEKLSSVIGSMLP